jgi:hypothetical protein
VLKVLPRHFAATFLIYCSLESLSSIPEAEAHEHVLKLYKGGDDGSFLDVGGCYGFLVVPLDNVDLAEDGASFLGSMCRGDAHAEFDLLMIPAFLSLIG